MIRSSSEDTPLDEEQEAERPPERAGFRLHRLEVLNWGTFNRHVWSLSPAGDNALVTGDIGSGKSTLVDALTTLLVPPQKLAYNKAADATRLERSLRSYVLGYYKKERSDEGHAAKPVALRDQHAYSVVLGTFYNDGYERHVTLAQVFWWKKVTGQPERMYIVAESPMSIAEHFGDFGAEISALKKRLQSLPKVKVRDTYPPYSTLFCRHFGIDNPQALELFHQTVSMKSVGNLTDFVRQHMLEPFDVEDRIKALIAHFDDLTRAHEAVLKAKAQIERLTPIVDDCRRLNEITELTNRLRASRDALRAWFAELKCDLLNKRLANLAKELGRLDNVLQGIEDLREKLSLQRDEVRDAISANGGDRLEQLKRQIRERQKLRDERKERARAYNTLAGTIGLKKASDADTFAANQHAISGGIVDAEDQATRLTNQNTEFSVEFARLSRQHVELEEELESLRRRQSNIPFRMLKLRELICSALDLESAMLPFAGELIQVREEDHEWEGVAERLLHGFGLSILVADVDYPRVAAWVNRTHLSGRLVYYRVRTEQTTRRVSRTRSNSLVHKLAIKPDTEFYDWLDGEITQRFDFVCCTSMDQFRREPRAVTRAGQIKRSHEHHEKDDRHRIDDRSRYVLGWSNQAKIAAIEADALRLEGQMQRFAQQISAIQEEQGKLKKRITALQQLTMFRRFDELDWEVVQREVDALARERDRLESESDVLRTLQAQLKEIEGSIKEVVKEHSACTADRGAVQSKQEKARTDLADCSQTLEEAGPEARDCFAHLEGMRLDALGDHVLTVESCDNREKDMRKWLQDQIDAEDKKISRLREKIVTGMQAYADDYPIETQEVDVAVESGAEYEAMLAQLETDDLPRFERRFKELLNENTIREVANFQSQLKMEGETIKERIETINGSLHSIDYNAGRYIKLEILPTADRDIREFRDDLRACTEGALTGSDDDAYSEAKFLQVKTIIERFRGREGTAESDRRWTRKVTDVRNWFSFAASERWREDDREHEHYADSGGKSGGQKEKLAYTVLAASLAYQFGLEWGVTRSRSFRFVVIDEAFGRGSDESAQYGLELFQRLNLQLLIVTPLQKIHIIEPYVEAVGFVHCEDGRKSMVRNLTIEEYRAERAARLDDGE